MKKYVIWLCMLVFLVACSKEESPEVKKGVNDEMLGQWQGNIELPQSPLEIILSLKEKSGTLSVPAQGVKDYPFKEVSYDGNKVLITIDLQGSNIVIDGKLQGNLITGTFKQNGNTLPIKLTPYKEEKASYESINIPVNGGNLKAALQHPEKEGSYPLAIIIAGSGPTDKDGNTIGAGKNNSLKMLAEDLAKQGIASIRYDKRGIGDNAPLTTKEEDLSIEKYVEDVNQVIKYAISENKFKSIHIIGHSEGSLIGMLAAQNSNIASFTSIAGAGRPADEILLEQLEGKLTSDLTKETTEILASLKEGESVATISTELQPLFRPSVQPYLMSWLKYDPAKSIQKVTAPVLIIQGAHDIQVPVSDAKILKANNEEAKLMIVSKMNHILKDAPDEIQGNMATYTNPTLPLSTELVEAITGFIHE